MKRAILMTLLLTLFSTSSVQQIEGATGSTLVRAAHTSPGTPELDITLAQRATASNAPAFDATPTSFTALQYKQVTDFVEIPVGEYDIALEHNGQVIHKTTVTFAPSVYYTLAAAGLWLPEEFGGTANEESGFWQWLTDLFGGGPAQGNLALRLELFPEELSVQLQENEQMVRAIHLAPGMEPFDIVVPATDTVLIADLAFTQASTLQPVAGDPGGLEVRMAGSRAMVLELPDAAREPGTLTTIFLVGTPVEEAPLAALVVSHPPLVPPVTD
jgi:hypothetical protein